MCPKQDRRSYDTEFSRGNHRIFNQPVSHIAGLLNAAIKPERSDDPSPAGFARRLPQAGPARRRRRIARSVPCVPSRAVSRTRRLSRLCPRRPEGGSKRGLGPPDRGRTAGEAQSATKNEARRSAEPRKSPCTGADAEIEVPASAVRIRSRAGRACGTRTPRPKSWCAARRFRR